MRILFVWPAAAWSVFDVARGYREALARQGHEIKDFRLYNRLQLMGLALGQIKGAPDKDLELVSKLASETLIVEAAYHQADLVVIMSGLAFHPNALWVLRQWRKPVRVALLLTESPYEDEDQKYLADMCDYVFTNERTSARRHGWHYLRHAYEPALHQPSPWRLKVAPPEVFIVGTGWQERVEYLRAVDWATVRLQIRGFWPIEKGSQLAPYYKEGVMDNREAAKVYSASRVSLNFHRQAQLAEGGSEVIEGATPAESLNPRAYEISACGGFQISDWRAELDEVYGDSVPVYHSPRELGELCRYYLAHESERRRLADLQRQRVQGNTFGARASELMDVIGTRPA